MEQMEHMGVFHKNTNIDLGLSENGTDGTDETAFSKNLIKSIYKVIKIGGNREKDRNKNVYRILPHLFRSICSVNKRSYVLRM